MAKGSAANRDMRNFTLLDKPDQIKIVEEVRGVRSPVPFPMPVGKVALEFWKHGTWQELRAMDCG